MLVRDGPARALPAQADRQAQAFVILDGIIGAATPSIEVVEAGCPALRVTYSSLPPRPDLFRVGMLDDLILALRDSLGRLERLLPAGGLSPVAELQLATLLHSQAGLLSAIAGELALRAHEDLGRFGTEVVEVAWRARDPETAACEVAEAFLCLNNTNSER